MHVLTGNSPVNFSKNKVGCLIKGMFEIIKVALEQNNKVQTKYTPKYIT